MTYPLSLARIGLFALGAAMIAPPAALAQQASQRAPEPAPAAPLKVERWPIVVDTPQGTFVYATEAATNVGISPYQNNLAIGYKALNPTTHRSPKCNSLSGFDGFCGDEVAFGAYALGHDVTGRDNTAIGDHALANLVSGEGNTAIGSSAAANIHTSGGVDAFGVAACQNATDYRGPITCIGQAALEFAEPSSQYTVALGYQAGLHARTAEFSTILGVAAGFSARINSHSVLVGEGSCHNAIAVRNVICLGTINGPAGGELTDRLWVGGTNDTPPILYGDLRSNLLGVNTTTLAKGAALTLGRGNLALERGFGVQWNGDVALSRSAPGTLVVSDGHGDNAKGALALARIDLSPSTSLTAPAAGELRVGAGEAGTSGGHVVAAYVRTVPTEVGKLATIDPSPAIGDRALVTDAVRCDFSSPVSGGGRTTCPVYYDGTAWVAG